MLRVLKVILATAAFVVGGTVATAAVSSVVVLLLASEQANSGDSGLVAAAISTAFMAGALGGLIFSAVSLPIAALTMPPTLGLAHLLKLPRPLVDCIGGGLAALLVSGAVISLFESLARSKGGEAPDADMRLVLDVCALLGGGALGYLRYVVVKKYLAPTPALPQPLTA
jgi:hypothetical protein